MHTLMHFPRRSCARLLGPVRAPHRAQPPPRLSASLAPRRREVVVGVPPAQAAVTEPGLPVEIEPLERMAPRAARGVDGVVHLLVTPVHLESLLRLHDPSVEPGARP